MFDLAKILTSYDFHCCGEIELQEAIAGILTAEGIAFEREVKLNKTDRIDFMIGAAGVELKIGHSYSDVVRQLHRYSAVDRIEELVLITTKLRHSMPDTIGEKKLTTVQLALMISL